MDDSSTPPETNGETEYWWTPFTRPIRSRIEEFLRVEASGGIILFAAALAALAWANIDGHSYHDVWGQELTLGFGELAVTETIEGWVSDALMAVFFFVVGLEIKREIVFGELRDPKTASLPLLGALGGMALPALVYLAFNVSSETKEGFGIPVATDIAFALGVLALLGSRIPAGLRVFLLTLAVADDIGGITIIAIFYTSDLEALWLGLALAGLALFVAMWRVGIGRDFPYVIVGLIVWYAALRSGVHATIAGVALGLLTPASPVRGRDVLRDLEHALHPWSAFLVLPVFALASAGVSLSGDTLSDAVDGRLFWGIALGLVLGKCLGITALTMAAVRLGIGRLPAGVGFPHVLGAALLGGIGFTVALFIATLSFADTPVYLDEAKLGVLAGSLVAGVLGCAVLLLAPRMSETIKIEDRR